MLGLDAEKVMLAEYDKEWNSYYTSEFILIKNALGDSVIDIQHIGSTSIVGMKAKPIIDILVGLESFLKINTIIKNMENIGYIYAYWAGIPNDYTFRKGNFTTHLVHIVEYGKENWFHNIVFRDKLRNNPDLVKQYEELKEELVKKFPDSREKYTEGKNKFIADVIKSEVLN